MLISILFTGLLSLSPLPPSDTSKFVVPQYGAGVILGAQVAIPNFQDGQTAFGPVAGFYLFHQMNIRCGIQLEFQVRQASGYKYSSAFEDYTVVPAGASKGYAEFHLRSLLFFEMPILLKLQALKNPRHQFITGIRPSFNRINSEKSGSWGYSVQNGILPHDFSGLSLQEAVTVFDVGFVAGWSYAFSNRIALDLRYTQGFTDLTADNFFKSKSNTLNSDFQCSLRCNF